MLEEVKKYFGFAKVEEAPVEAKTVASVLTIFNTVLTDLKEVADGSTEAIKYAEDSINGVKVYAESRIAILENTISEKVKESERATAIISKLEELLK